MSIPSQRFRKPYHYEFESFKSPRNTNQTTRNLLQSSTNYLINDFQITSRDSQILQNATKLKLERSDQQYQLNLKKQELRLFKHQQQNIKKLFQGLKNTYTQQMNKASTLRDLQSQAKMAHQKNLQNQQYQAHLLEGQQQKIKLIKNDIDAVSTKVQFLGQAVEKMRDREVQLRKKVEVLENYKQNIRSNANNLQKQEVLAAEKAYIEMQMQGLNYKQKLLTHQLKSLQINTLRKKLAITKLQHQQAKIHLAEDKICKIGQILQGKLQKTTQSIDFLQEQIKKEIEVKQTNQKRLSDLKELLLKLKLINEKQNQVDIPKATSNKSILIVQHKSESQKTNVFQQRDVNIQIENKETLKNIRGISNTENRKCITEQLI